MGCYHSSSLLKLLTRLQVCELVTLRYVPKIFVPQAGKNLCDRKIAPSKHRLRNNVKRDSNDIVTASSSSLPVAPSGAKATNKHPSVITFLGQSLQFSPRVCLKVTAPRVSRPAPLPFALRVPGEGLPCDVRRGLLKGVANPLPASLKEVNFYRLLPRLFPQILVADDVWPAYLKNPSEAGVNESLNSFHSGDGGSPGLGSIKQYRLHDGVKDPDFSAGAEK